MLYWNYTFVRELLDIVLSVFFPVVDVGISPYSERSTSEDDGAYVVIKSSGLDSLLVGLGCAGFLYAEIIVSFIMYVLLRWISQTNL